MKTKNLAAAYAVFAAAILGPAPAAAQSLCGAREAVIDMLGARYGETVRSIGLAGATESWRSSRRRKPGPGPSSSPIPTGVACLVASGQHYEQVVAGPEGEPL
jgi:hypothetical protein